MIRLKQWLVSITAAALLLSMAETMMPKGSVRQVGKLTFGLVLMIVILHPILQVDYAVLAGSLSMIRNDLGTYQAEPETENFNLMKDIIETRCSAYIQSKAEQRGINCRAEVLCKAEKESEYPYPAEVTVFGALTETEIGYLKRMIEEELSVPVQAQTYSQ